MRCRCCDKNLSDYESTIKSSITNEYLDTCISCLKVIDIHYVGRPDLEEEVNPIYQKEEDYDKDF